MTLGELGLDFDTHAVAAALVEACPWVNFTSGRRTVIEQARAMAENTVKRRDWISLTYLPSPVSSALSAWVLATPEAKSVNALLSGFLPIMRKFSPEDLGKLSRHLDGRAFDVEPQQGRPGEKICGFLRAAAQSRNGKFLEREGGIQIWHFQL